jgi:hypothetical protein
MTRSQGHTYTTLCTNSCQCPCVLRFHRHPVLGVQICSPHPTKAMSIPSRRVPVRISRKSVHDSQAIRMILVQGGCPVHCCRPDVDPHATITSISDHQDNDAITETNCEWTQLELFRWHGELSQCAIVHLAKLLNLQSVNTEMTF